MIGTEITYVQNLDVVALVEVARPKGRVLEGNTRDGDVFGKFSIKKTRTLLVLVRTLGVPLAAQAEVTPIGRTIAIHRAFAAERKAIGALHVDQGGEVLAPFALDARHLDGEVIDVLAAQEYGSTRKIEVHTLPKMKRTTLVYSFGHYNHTSPIGCRAVDKLLDSLGLHLIG